MEKKKTTEVEYDLSYYLGGNEEELLGRSSQQHSKMTGAVSHQRMSSHYRTQRYHGVPSFHTKLNKQGCQRMHPFRNASVPK